MLRHKALVLVGIAFAVLAPSTPTNASAAVDFSVLINFNGTNGAAPTAPLIQATDGSFYGTTASGGDGASCGDQHGCGTVFRITPGGELNTIYSFCALANCADGGYPSAGLVQAPDGSFYGTTFGGADLTCDGGCGTIFKITAEGKLTTLHRFHGADGASPSAALILGSDGDFYGMTWLGGIAGGCWYDEPYGCGTIFKMTAQGVFTTLHRFCKDTNCADGALPLGSLVQATNGKFYGTTSGGGRSNHDCTEPNYACGTIFEIRSSGEFKTLFDFCPNGDCPGGYNPGAGLIQAADGNLYGTSLTGAFFKMTLQGRFRNVSAVNANEPNTLIQGTDGNFYGTAYFGGTAGVGTVFKVTPKGKASTLHSFDYDDGDNPDAGLLQATDGTFYGTTQSGGSDPGGGVVFKLSVGLGAFVALEPGYGKVGAKIVILGNNLQGATGVTFNGTAADFDVASDSEITATVPSGATSGTVEVTLPDKTLKSNVAFRVLQ
jgi:uncharacterized repeat protein (TIGR03803 family)